MKHTPRWLLIGTGGHARVVLDAMSCAGFPLAECALDAAKSGSVLHGVPVTGGDEQMVALRAEGIDRFVLGLGGTGTSLLRAKVWARALSAGLNPLAVVHPSAIISRFATLGPGCQVLAGAVINAGAMIGEGVIVNTCCVVEHDCVVGKFCHLAPRSCLGGGVQLGIHCHIGLGAVVREYMKIGDHCLVGAGAAVVSDFASGSTALGVPARSTTRQS